MIRTFLSGTILFVCLFLIVVQQTEATDNYKFDFGIENTCEGQTQSYMAYNADSVKVEDKEQGFRNGWARIATAEYTSSSKVRLRIEPLN